MPSDGLMPSCVVAAAALSGAGGVLLGFQLRRRAPVWFDLPAHEPDVARWIRARRRGLRTQLAQGRNWLAAAAAAILAGALAVPVERHELLPSLLLMLVLLPPIAMIDWQEAAVPDGLVLPLGMLGLVHGAVRGPGLFDAVAAAILNAATIAALLWLAAARRAARPRRRGGATAESGALAWGDVLLMAGVGGFVSLEGLPAFWLLAGLVHAVAFVMARLTHGGERLPAALPLAPAICVACFAVQCARAWWGADPLTLLLGLHA